MRWIKPFLVIILLGNLGIHLYFHRTELTGRFDAEYWRVKYEQSQWLLPLSWRTIGDDGLYLYEGYKIIHGYDPTLVNAEVPPLPKYLIGLSIIIFGNGHWHGVLFTVGSVILFYFLTSRILKSKFLALALTALFSFDPLVTEQFTLTMLDSPQLFFILLYFLICTFLDEKRPAKHQYLYITLLGAVLGIFSSIRYPVLSPILAFFSAVYLWRHLHKARYLFLFFASAFIFYLLPYTRYFVMGHNLIEWFRVQKWIFNFYRSSKLEANVGSIWTTLIKNDYKNLFTRSYEAVSEWTPVWSVITVAAIIGSFKGLFNKEKNITADTWRVMLRFFIVAMLVYTLIPFWTRYLILLLPFLYLGFGYLIKNKKEPFIIFFCGLMLCVNSIASMRLLLPTPESTIKQFFYDWNGGFFQDMYESIDRQTKQQISRNDFFHKGLTLLRDGEIEHIQVEAAYLDWSRFISPQQVPVRILYSTRNLGMFTEEKRIPVIKEGDRWVIRWNWDLFISGLPVDGKLETSVLPARRGSIIGQDKKIIYGDFPSFMVWIQPDKVDVTRENDMLLALEKQFLERMPKAFFHHRYVFNTDPAYPVPVGVLPNPPDEKTKSLLLSYPGLSLTPAFGRSDIFYVELRKEGHVENTQYLECCSRLYTTTAYDGESGTEKEKNADLKGYNGGSLILKDKNGNIIRTIIETKKTDGKDIYL